MNPFLFFIRRSVYRLTLILAIFCCIEIFMYSTEGTKPNYMFPWGRYVETLAGFAVVLFIIAYVTRIGPRDFEPPQPHSSCPSVTKRRA